nr:LLM class flavin-dependent oxidoreductase [uncultured Cupriavidus sp.]
MAELYDELGFYCYHLPEHHATTHNPIPSEPILLAAVAQRTRKLRLCPPAYPLPAHHPLRLAEEICMLDHLSGGRLEFGVGRGTSRHEDLALGIDPTTVQARYVEAYAILRQYLGSYVVNFDGQVWKFSSVPVERKPLQSSPPMWYAPASAESAAWAARENMNIMCGGPVHRVRSITDRFREEFQAHHGDTAPLPLAGVHRYIVMADTDAEALEIGKRAWHALHASFYDSRHKHDTRSIHARPPQDFGALIESGMAIAGSPSVVREQLLEQAENGAFNYLIGTYVFGDLSLEEASRSVRLFCDHVRPAFENVALDLVA